MTQQQAQQVIADAVKILHEKGWWVSGSITLMPPGPNHSVEYDNVMKCYRIKVSKGIAEIAKNTLYKPDAEWCNPIPPKTISDGPPCPKCGMMTRRTGTCYTCQSCGETTSCG